MSQKEWSARHITDYAQRILKQIPSRAPARRLHVVDGVSIVMVVLWSLLCGERKIGLIALERSGVDRFELARELKRMMSEKEKEHPFVFDKRLNWRLFLKTGEPCSGWDFELLIEPLLRQAEQVAREP